MSRKGVTCLQRRQIDVEAGEFTRKFLEGDLGASLDTAPEFQDLWKLLEIQVPEDRQGDPAMGVEGLDQGLDDCSEIALMRRRAACVADPEPVSAVRMFREARRDGESRPVESVGNYKGVPHDQMRRSAKGFGGEDGEIGLTNASRYRRDFACQSVSETSGRRR